MLFVPTLQVPLRESVVVRCLTRLLKRRQRLEEHLLSPPVRTTMQLIPGRQPDAKVSRTKLTGLASKAGATYRKRVPGSFISAQTITHKSEQLDS